MNTDTTAPVQKRTHVNQSQQQVLDVLIAADRNRVGLLTATDIRERLEVLHSPRRFEKGWVTARLAELAGMGSVEKSEETRIDPRTKRYSHLWFVPRQQARLCA